MDVTYRVNSCELSSLAFSIRSTACNRCLQLVKGQSHHRTAWLEAPGVTGPTTPHLLCVPSRMSWVFRPFCLVQFMQECSGSWQSFYFQGFKWVLYSHSNMMKLMDLFEHIRWFNMINLLKLTISHCHLRSPLWIDFLSARHPLGSSTPLAWPRWSSRFGGSK